MGRIIILILIGILTSCSSNTNKDSSEHKVEQTDISNLQKTSVLLGEDKFWRIVDASLQNSKSEGEQEKVLIQELTKLTPVEIIGFELRLKKLSGETYTSEMWCACYIMNGGCSDDGFEYFRNWVISRGKEVYYKAKENPDNLIEEVKGGFFAVYEWEHFWYTPVKAFSRKTGREIYDYIDYDAFYVGEGKRTQLHFNWKEDKPETMKAICPRLFERF